MRGAFGLGLVVEDPGSETSDVETEGADRIVFPLGGGLGFFIFHMVVRK